MEQDRSRPWEGRDAELHQTQLCCRNSPQRCRSQGCLAASLDVEMLKMLCKTRAAHWGGGSDSWIVAFLGMLGEAGDIEVCGCPISAEKPDLGGSF